MLQLHCSALGNAKLSAMAVHSAIQGLKCPLLSLSCMLKYVVHVS